MAQGNREMAEMIAKFRTPPGFSWHDLANDIETVLKIRSRDGMSEWQTIETAPEYVISSSIILWNGKRVFFGWQNDDGWHDSGNSERQDEAENPQPTHWMPLPEPPKERT